MQRLLRKRNLQEEQDSKIKMGTRSPLFKLVINLKQNVL
jgi:hypothetical protein